MAIKAAAARPWSGREHTATTWYEPYTAVEEVDRGVRFALSTRGVHAFCTPGDVGVLATALAAAAGDLAMDGAERESAMAAVAGESSIFPMPRA
jgi:hypothetical protein